jgi:hypothetical protein
MPKWTRYNLSIKIGSPVSTSYRIDVHGKSSDIREGKKPMVHSGLFYASNQVAYYRHGLGLWAHDYQSMIYWDDTPPSTMTQGMSKNENQEGVIPIASADLGLLQKRNDSTNIGWWKIVIRPNRVV